LVLIRAPTGKGCSVGRITIVRYGERLEAFKRYAGLADAVREAAETAR
jgi:hypothetical protein